MQLPVNPLMPLRKSRLFWRVLVCVVLAFFSFCFAGYIITNNVETKAQDAFLKKQQETVSTRLSGLRRGLYGTISDRSETFGLLQAELKHLLLQEQLAYLIVLAQDGGILGEESTGFAPGSLDQVTELGAKIENLPFLYTAEIAGVEHFASVIDLPRTAGLRAIYGIPVHVVQTVASEHTMSHRVLVGAGLGIMLLAFFFISLSYIFPLRKLLKYPWSDSGAAARPPAAKRKDELGLIWQNFAELHRHNAVLDARPLLTSGSILQAVATVLEGFECGALVLSPEGFVQSGNRAVRKILGYTGSFQHKQAEDLLLAVLNQWQVSVFRACLEMPDPSEADPLEMVTEDAQGVHVYGMRFSRHSLLGEAYILCVFYDISNERRLQEIQATAAFKLEQAIKERTEELLRVNEQLRQENSERRSIEQALVRAESRYREIINNSIEGIFQRSPDGRLVSANSSMARILGYDSVEDLLEAYQGPGKPICYASETEIAITELLDIRGWVSQLEFQALMQDGNPVWVAMNARRVADSNGETLYYEGFLEDITSRKKTEEKLVHQAFHDPLTGLPNRTLFLDRLRMSLRRSKRHSEYLFAVLYLDLDRFKNINDSFGHSVGDKVLNHATERILQCVRDVDTVTRFGGDEFAVLLNDLKKPSQAVLIAKRISAALNESIHMDGQEVVTGASIGIVINSPDYETPEEILRDADTAMYRVKMQGRRGYTVFNERMREETIAALEMENDLRGAVERDEIDAFYQPLIDMENNSVAGFEALMRWRRNGDMVSPVAFIPIAEESGLIYELGLRMLEIVCGQIIEWNKILGHNNYIVHVNISAKQLMAAHFWRDAREVIVASGASPQQIIFEITESVFLDYGSQVISIMNIVRDFGIRLCLDDFGTGFSSLSYLRTLPLESLKVDRSFIVDIGGDEYSEVILRNLIAMGRDLGLNVISEGVDQAAQVEVLRMVGCRFAQGFYFAEPLAPDEAIEYMQRDSVMF